MKRFYKGEEMTRTEEILSIREMMGAIKARKGWYDFDLARRLGCHTQTVKNMRKDPGKTRHETVRALKALYEETCKGVRM